MLVRNRTDLLRLVDSLVVNNNLVGFGMYVITHKHGRNWNFVGGRRISLLPVKLMVRRSGYEKGINYTPSSIQRILHNGTLMHIADSIIYMCFGFCIKHDCRRRSMYLKKYILPTSFRLTYITIITMVCCYDNHDNFVTIAHLP